MRWLYSNPALTTVVVKTAKLNDVQKAQIEDIVKRKPGIAGENIIIRTVASIE
jgi:hypothetical protein